MREEVGARAAARLVHHFVIEEGVVSLLRSDGLDHLGNQVYYF